MQALIVVALALAGEAPVASAPASLPAQAPLPAAASLPRLEPPGPASLPATAETLTLEQVLAAVDEANPDLGAARARLDGAREMSRKLWAAYLPTITAGGSYTFTNKEAKLQLPTGYWIRDLGVPVGPVFDPTRPVSIDNPPGDPTSLIMTPSGLADMTIQKQNMFSGQVRLTQAVFAPALWPAIENAYLAEDVAELGVESTRREILFAAAQLYYGVVGLEEVVRAQEDFLKMSREHEQDAKVRFELGSAPEVAYLRAQIERIRAEQDARRAAMSYSSALSALATLLDRDPDFDVVRPQAPPAGTPSTHPANERPDLQVARLSVRLAEGARRGVRATYLPNLGLFLQYSISNTKGFTGEYGSWMGGLALNWTLWDGGLREAQMREASAAVVASQASLRAAEARSRDEVRRARLDLESAQANRVKADEQLRAARETATMVQRSYDLGAATYLELVDASTALLAAELGVITENLNADLAALRVAKATGEWRP